MMCTAKIDFYVLYIMYFISIFYTLIIDFCYSCIYYIYILSLLCTIRILRHSRGGKQEINQKAKTNYIYIYVCVCLLIAAYRHSGRCIHTHIYILYALRRILFNIVDIIYIVKPKTLDNGLLLRTFGSNFYCLQATVIKRVL